MSLSLIRFGDSNQNNFWFEFRTRIVFESIRFEFFLCAPKIKPIRVRFEFREFEFDSSRRLELELDSNSIRVSRFFRIFKNSLEFSVSRLEFSKTFRILKKILSKLFILFIIKLFKYDNFLAPQANCCTFLH